jgi:interferon gamma-inducible protein 30
MKDVSTIMDLRCFPYGNAQESKNADGTWKFTCQHGTNECIGNMYEACAIEHYNYTIANNVPYWWGYFYCLELSENAGVKSVASNCAAENGIDFNIITQCAGTYPDQGSSDDGNPLMHNIAVATNNLIPPHQYTPWVVMNGSPLTQAQLDQSLTKLVCNAYTGTTKPAACSAFVSERVEKRDVDVKVEVA